MQPGSITFDITNKPLHIVRIRGQMTPELYEQFFAFMEELFLVRGRIAVIIDIRATKSGGKSGWDTVSAWMRENSARWAKLSIGTAIVFDNAPMRAALSAVLWRQKVPGPYAIVKDEKTALTWLRGQFKEAHLPFPAVTATAEPVEQAAV